LRDNLDEQPFDQPETARSYIEMFARAAEQSRKPHYLLTTRPALWIVGWPRICASTGSGSLAGLGEGLSAIDRLSVGAN
jgi:hypothetical protein